MAKMRVTSPNGYDHYWTKAGAHTSYPLGFEGTVKADVLAGAIASNKGEEVKLAPPPAPPKEKNEPERDT